MSEEAKSLLINELVQLETLHSTRDDSQSVHARKEYLHCVAQILIKAKESLEKEDFDNFLNQIGTPPDTARDIVEDFLYERYYHTEIAPLAQRHIEVIKQLSRIGDLYCENEQPFYAKMIVSLHDEAYELAEKIDRMQAREWSRNASKGFFHSVSYKDMTDGYFEHIKRMAENQEYVRQHIESMLAEQGFLDNDED
jgi:hypothetical protein